MLDSLIINQNFAELPDFSRSRSLDLSLIDFPQLESSLSENVFYFQNKFNFEKLNQKLDDNEFKGIPIEEKPKNIGKEINDHVDEIINDKEINENHLELKIPNENEKIVIEIIEKTEELYEPLIVSITAEQLNEINIELLKEAPFYEVLEFEPYSIKCQICLIKKEEYHSLSCSDSFCDSCIKLLLENYINCSYVFPDELLCPICSITIADKIVSDLGGLNLYEKMINLRESLKIQKLVAQKKALYCPIPGCEGFSHLIPNESITACTVCKCSICTLCSKSVHPAITCEEAKLIDPESDLDLLMLSQNWKKCPTCGVPVEKIDGCQFIPCYSPVCKGKNALCYLCGRFLIEDQHFNHYITAGPYGSTCNTLDGIPETVDRSKLIAIIDLDAPYNPLEGGGGEE